MDNGVVSAYRVSAGFVNMETMEKQTKLRKRFADYCLNLRSRRGVSQEWVEHRSREITGDPDFAIARSTLSRVEREGVIPSPMRLLTLARIYNEPIESFFLAIGADRHEVSSAAAAEKRCEDFVELLRHSTEPDSAIELISYILTAESEAFSFLTQAMGALVKIHPPRERFKSVVGALERMVDQDSSSEGEKL